jgi:hypothetical protein
MISNLSRRPDPAELQRLQELLSRLDPQSELAVDAHSGEILVRGEFDEAQLATAIAEAGIRAFPVKAKAEDTGGCCGSCGCG